MKTIQVKAVKRENYGKKAAKAVRREGQIPAVLYGGGETVSFSVGPREIKPLIYTPNSYIVDLEIDGKTEKAVLRDVQFHPILGADPSSLEIVNRPPTRSKPLYMKVWEARKADGLDYDPEDERQQHFLAEITKYNLRSID